MSLMIEKGIRGGNTNTGSIRYAKVNHPYETKPSSYINYEDANKLYDWVMLPLNGFKILNSLMMLKPLQ